MLYSLQKKSLLVCFLGITAAMLFTNFQAKDPLAPDLVVEQVVADTAAAMAWVIQAEILRDSGQYASSIQYFEKARKAYQPYLSASVDSLLWSNYLRWTDEIGQLYIRLRQYERSMSLFDSILQMAAAVFGEQHEFICQAYHDKGRVAWRLGQYEAAIQQHEKALEIAVQLFDSVHTLVADGYGYLGRVEYTRGAPGKAIAYFERSLDLNRQLLGPNHPDLVNMYIRLGLVCNDRGLYDRALDCYTRGLTIQLAVKEQNQGNLADLYTSIGSTYNRLGNYQTALQYFLRGLDIWTTHYGDNHRGSITTYHNLGNVYANLGSYEMALDYLQQARHNFIEKLGPDHRQLERIYHDLGNVYIDLGDFEKALEQYRKALSIKLEKLGKNAPSVANTYNSMGITYTQLQAYEKAIDHFEQAIQIQRAQLGEQHPTLALSYMNLGVVYDWQGKYRTALHYYEKALDIQHQAFGDKHPSLVQTLNNMGLIHASLGDHQQSLGDFQRALEANAIDSIPFNFLARPDAKTRFLSPTALVSTLQHKAGVLFSRYRADTTHLEDLKFAQQHYFAAIYWIDKIRKSYNRAADKGLLLKDAYVIFEGAIETCYALYQELGEEKLLEEAFWVFEQSKSIPLLEALQENNAAHQSNIPTGVLTQERNIDTQIAHCEKRLFEEQVKKGEADSLLMAVLQGRLFALKHAKDSLLLALEHNFPKYYQLKHETATVTLPEMQEHLQNQKTTVLEFFVGDSSLFVFVLNDQSRELIKLEFDSSFNDQVQALNQSLLQGGPTQSANYQDRKTKIAKIAYQLHQKLIAPIARRHQLDQKLVIVPDGILCYLPFDLLIGSPASKEEHWNDFDFLIKKHQISYCFSSTLLLEMKDHHHEEQHKGLLAMAPQFEGQGVDQDSSWSDPVESRRAQQRSANLGALHYNISEVLQLKRLSQAFRQKILTGSQATLAGFYSHAPQYSILHLSSHAKANDKYGDFSWLAFHATGDQDQAFLYSCDLYHLNLSTDLVVLSACETALGEFHRGEGIRGLTQGFSFAGAKSLITSLWEVNDKSTQILMEHLYQGLLAGQEKDQALRAAKLSLLQHNDVADPFHWAAFIPIGDMAPINLGPSSFQQQGWAIAGLLTSLAVFFYIRKKRTARK